MNKPDERIIQSLASLKDNKDFEVFRGWLEQSFADQCMEINKISDETQLRWAQGRNQCLEIITTSITNARDTLEKMRRKETRRPD